MPDSTDPNPVHTATFRPPRTRRWSMRYNGKHRQPDEPNTDEHTEILLDPPQRGKPGPDEQPTR